MKRVHNVYHAGNPSDQWTEEVPDWRCNNRDNREDKKVFPVKFIGRVLLYDAIGLTVGALAGTLIAAWQERREKNATGS